MSSDVFVGKRFTCVNGHVNEGVMRRSSPTVCKTCKEPRMLSVSIVHTPASLHARMAELEAHVSDLMPAACDPANACATHGRCWTHSEWADGEVTMRPLTPEQLRQAKEALSKMREAEAAQTPGEEQADSEQIEAFLLALSALTKRFGVVVASCGCCLSPFLLRLDAAEADGHYVINYDGTEPLATDLKWVSAPR